MRLTSASVICLLALTTQAAGAQRPKQSAPKAATSTPARARAAAGPPANFAPVDQPLVMALADVVALHATPDLSGQPSERLAGVSMSEAKATEATNAAVRVVSQGKQGWASWGDVLAPTSAIVVDAGSGKVEARIPFGFGVDAVAYSPDRSRAVFYSSTGAEAGYEVTTADWSVARRIVAPHKEDDYRTVNGFSYASDGSLRAFVVWQDASGASHTDVVAVTEPGTPAGPSLLSLASSGLLIAPDGKTAFSSRYVPNAPENSPDLVDVVDTATMKVRTTLSLPSGSVGQLLTNDSGSELYGVAKTSIVAYDTKTGAIARTLRTGFPANETASLSKGGAVNDVVLATSWGEGTTAPHTAWVGSAGAVALDPDSVRFGVALPSGTYSVNTLGTAISRLDRSMKSEATVAVNRPELRVGWLDSWQPVHVMAAVPGASGAQIVLLVGMYEGD